MADTLSAFNAVAMNDADWLRDLIRAGLNPDLTERDLASAFVSESREDVVECLTNLGMPRSAVYINSFCGRTLAMVASEKGNVEVLQILIDYGADMFLLDDSRRSALSHASANGCKQCVYILLQHGVSVNNMSESGMSPLMYAAKGQSVEVVNMLLDSGAEVDAASSLGVTPLMWSASRGCVQVVRALVDAGADMDKTDGQRRTTLMHACVSACIPVMKLLLSLGANVHQSDRHGLTTLMSAAQVGSVEAIRLLIEHGANVHSVDSNGKNPLLYAVQASSLPCVEELLKHGADINHRDFKGKTAVVYCIEKHVHEILHFLLCHEASADIQDFSKKTPIMYAIEYNCRDCLTLLQVYFSSSIDVEDDKGATALIYSITVNSLHALDFAIRSGANVRLRNAKGLTPVMICAAKNNKTFLKYLLESCMKNRDHLSTLNTAVSTALEDVDNRRRTVLMHAAIHDSIDTLQALLQLGVKPDAKDRDGNTAMMLAAAHGSARSLLKCLSTPPDSSPNPNLQNAFGETALILAAQNGHEECVTYLVQTSNVNVSDAQGRTALMYASLAHGVMCVRILLNAGCSVDAVDSSGSTALMLALDKVKHREVPVWDRAATSRKLTCLKLLLSKGADVNVCRMDGKNAIKLALEDCKSEDEVLIGRALLSESAVFPDVSVLEGSIFLRLVFRGNVDLIKLLVERGMSPTDAKFVPPNEAEELGSRMSPLGVAVACGHVEIVTFFLDIWFTTRYDVTALLADDRIRTVVMPSAWSGCDKEKTVSLIEELFSQPLSLFRLSLTAVNSALSDSVGGNDATSKAVGQCSRRAYALKKTGLPMLLQKKLLFDAEPLRDRADSKHIVEVADTDDIRVEGASIQTADNVEAVEHLDDDYKDMKDAVKPKSVQITYECACPDLEEESNVGMAGTNNDARNITYGTSHVLLFIFVCNMRHNLSVNAYSTSSSAELQTSLSSHTLKTMNVSYCATDGLEKLCPLVPDAYLFKEKHRATGWSQGMFHAICGDQQVFEFCKRSSYTLGQENKMAEFETEKSLGDDIHADLCLTKMKYNRSRSEYNRKAFELRNRTSQHRTISFYTGDSASRNSSTPPVYCNRKATHNIRRRLPQRMITFVHNNKTPPVTTP